MIDKGVPSIALRSKIVIDLLLHLSNGIFRIPFKKRFQGSHRMFVGIISRIVGKFQRLVAVACSSRTTSPIIRCCRIKNNSGAFASSRFIATTRRIPFVASSNAIEISSSISVFARKSRTNDEGIYRWATLFPTSARIGPSMFAIDTILGGRHINAIITYALLNIG